MSEKSTRIAQLPPVVSDDNNDEKAQTDIVQNILNDLEQDSGEHVEEQDNQYNETQQRYQARQFAPPQDQMYTNMQKPKGGGSSSDQNMRNSYGQPKRTLSTKDVVLREVKNPLIVILLFALLNISMCDKVLSKYIPKICNSSGGVNLLGVALKATVAGILYYIISKLV